MVHAINQLKAGFARMMQVMNGSDLFKRIFRPVIGPNQPGILHSYGRGNEACPQLVPVVVNARSGRL